MGGVKLINADEFLQKLKDEGLVLTRSQLSSKERRIQAKKVDELLNRDSIQVSLVVKHKLTHYSTYRGLQTSPYAKPGEIYKDSRGRLMVMTSVVKHIRALKCLD